MAAKRVKPGDDLTIDANVYNAAVDLYQQKNGQQPRGSFRPEQPQQTRLVIRNDSGADLPAFSVVSFNGPLTDPTVDLDGFQERIVMSALGSPPAETYQWGITQEPIPAGDFGEAAAAGLSVVQIAVSYGMIASQITFAAPGGNTAALTPASCGMCRVIWIQVLYSNPIYPGNANVWAIVNLG